MTVEAKINPVFAVRVWRQNLHWQEYFNHGDGKVHPTDTTTL